MYHIIKTIHSISGNVVMATWVENFPVTLHGVQKEIIGNDIKFTEYVVCSKCHSLYECHSCVIVSGSNRSSQKCEYVQLPNHQQRSFRQMCGTVLLKIYKKITSHF